MCGISGFLDLGISSSASDLQRIAMRMSYSLRHRGPDDAGAWVDPDAGIALSMRRLAILDLSPMGHQPMISISGRYVLVFNGEIYNYEDLREELSKQGSSYNFRGTSDTEVILAAFEHWGLEQSLIRFNGMFAIALWDRAERSLTLARDRFGEKPLYYSSNNGYFIFGSELKALRAHPCFINEIDESTVPLFLRYSYVPSPSSIYKNTYKLPAGSFLKISAGNIASRPCSYWSLHDVIAEARASQFTYAEHELVEHLDELLRDAVRIRMRSDVPLGAFLSGGIDSSIVAALMQAQSGKRIRTFSIGNHDEELDEAKEAAKVARHLGTDHTEVYVSAYEAMSVIPTLGSVYDEPFADSSQIPTILVSRIAKEHVTVALSGDGGDEIFGGYTRHIWGDSLTHAFRRFPYPLRKVAAAGIKTISQDNWDTIFRAGKWITPSRWQQRMPGYKLHKMARLLQSKNVHSLYEGLSSHWLNTSVLRWETTVSQSTMHSAFSNAAEEMMYLDTLGYLPDDALVKLDRATMSVSLEGRVPLLDHRLAAYAWRLPLHMRIRQRQGKWILRQLLYKYVPREMVDRPKSGFGIPIATWLRGPLRDWADSLLDENRMRHDGYFNPKIVQNMFREHINGKRNWEYQLWDVLMFQAWLDENRKPLNLADHTPTLANADRTTA